VTEKRALEIDEDMAFQRKEWLAQRLGVVLLFVFVLGALLGLTGMGGPLSHQVIGKPTDPVQLEYDRFVRRGGIAKVKVRLNGTSSEPRLWISSDYLDHAHIQSIDPRLCLSHQRQAIAQPDHYVRFHSAADHQRIDAASARWQ
jgi:hypothetical protein